LDVSSVDGEVPIKKWRVVGPFVFDKRELEPANAETRRVGLARDYLKSFGLAEASVDATTFLQIKRGTNRVSLDSRFDNRAISTNPDNNILQLDSVDYAVVYLATIIESARDQEIAIAAGADDNMRLWLNHKLLFTDRNKSGHALDGVQHLISAKLRRGTNFLLVKLGNLTDEWELIVTICPHEKALELALDTGLNPILDGSVVAPGQQLEVRSDLLPQPPPAEYKITNSLHKLVESAKLSYGRSSKHDLRRLKKNSLYFCSVSFGGRTIERPFYYGDVDAAYARLSREADMFDKTSDSVTIDLQAQLARLRHLLLPASRLSPFWDQKVAASIAEVEENSADLHQGDAAFRHAAGTHSRGYRSTVDDQVQHYWIHIPGKALNTGKPLPLVIALPYSVADLPFLESYFVAGFDETERYRTLGDEYGFAVLQVWGRGNHVGGAAIATADVFEALEAVRRDYSIDPDRIYLLGYCGGGRLALLLGERYPDRFAAIATEGPITDLHSDDLWSQYSSPLSATQNLVDTPVFITHDEADTTPFRDSVTFVSRCREAGVDVTLIRRHGKGGRHSFIPNPMAVKRSLFEFFKGKRIKTAEHSKVASNAALRRFGIGAGPIEDAFGSPILVVEGTQGTPEQNLVVQSIVEEFRDDWRETYFVECPWKKDTEVTDDDIRNKNLVVIGDKDTNSLMKRGANHLPVHNTPTGISVEGKNVDGVHLGYIFISPNPLNPKKYVVGIGMNQWKAVKGWKLYPSRDGIYDYFVFDLQGPTPWQRDAGYFDVAWGRPKETLLGKYPIAFLAGVVVVFLIAAVFVVRSRATKSKGIAA